MLIKFRAISSLIGVAALTITALGVPTESNAITFTSTASTVNIPDGSFNFQGLTIPTQPVGSEVIQSLNSVKIFGLTHNNYSDLTIYIERNGGQLVTYLTLSGFTNPNANSVNGDYTFVPTGGSSWTTAPTNPVPTGTYTSSTSFSQFDNISAANTYNLVVFDNNSNGITGSFTQFEMDVTLVPFEFEASAGLAFLGGAWLIRKKILSKKQA